VLGQSLMTIRSLLLRKARLTNTVKKLTYYFTKRTGFIQFKSQSGNARYLYKTLSCRHCNVQRHWW